MDISFHCKCGQHIVIDGTGAGQLVDRPKCGTPLEVPHKPNRTGNVGVDPRPAKPLVSVPPPAARQDTKQCPFCAETIKREAIVCKHCGRDLVARRLTEAVTVNVQGPAKSIVPTERARHRIGLLVILAISIVVGGFWFYQYAHRLSIPEIFKTQLMKFIEEANRINAMTSLGVSYDSFKAQVANAESSYNLALATWPNGFAPGAREEFAKADEGWRLVLDLWGLKIQGAGLSPKYRARLAPTEPDKFGYAQFIAYAGKQLVIRTHSMDNGEDEEFRGKNFLLHDDNISVLMTVAGAHFNVGASLVIAELPK